MPKALVPQQRMGNEEELAGTILYLASKVRLYMTLDGTSLTRICHVGWGLLQRCYNDPGWWISYEPCGPISECSLRHGNKERSELRSSVYPCMPRVVYRGEGCSGYQLDEISSRERHEQQGFIVEIPPGRCDI